MIQDIGNLHFDNQYHNQIPEDSDFVLVFDGKQICLHQESGHIQYLHYDEVLSLYQCAAQPIPQVTYLFSLEEQAFYLLEDVLFIKEHLAELAGFEFYKMFETRRMKPLELVFVAATGWHLYQWYHTNRFCGVCGQQTNHDEKERMLRCPQCGNMIFPRIVPAVIVGVTDKDRMIMTKYAGREYTRYALIAGFTEIGETVEETVSREVMEEVGVRVKNITYYKSQPWGFDGDLLLGYYCELDGPDTIRLDEQELSVAQWMDYKDIPEYHEGLSLTEEMMNTFKRRREEAKRSN